MPLLSADQVQRHGDNSFLHSRSGCKGEHLPGEPKRPRANVHMIDLHFLNPTVTLQLQDPEDRVPQHFTWILPPSPSLQRVQAVWYER